MDLYSYIQNKEVIWSDRYEVSMHWEFKSISKHYQKVAIRQTLIVNWSNKPLVGSALIDGYCQTVMKENLIQYKNWATEKIEKDECMRTGACKNEGTEEHIEQQLFLL